MGLFPGELSHPTLSAQVSATGRTGVGGATRDIVSKGLLTGEPKSSRVRRADVLSKASSVLTPQAHDAGGDWRSPADPGWRRRSRKSGSRAPSRNLPRTVKEVSGFMCKDKDGVRGVPNGGFDLHSSLLAWLTWFDPRPLSVLRTGPD